MHKAIAVTIGVLSLSVFYFDETYRLNSAEWVPEVLGGILAYISVAVWQVGKQKREEKAQSETSSRSDPEREPSAEEQRLSSED